MKIKKSRKERNLFRFLKQFSGYFIFCAIFSLVCIATFKFLPSDSPINNEFAIKKNTKTDENELQIRYLDPSTYHNVAANHEQNKIDIGLQLYRNENSQQSVIWFYNQITKDEQITTAILENANRNDIPLSLAFALAYTESGYNPTVEHSNYNKSVDRGLYQLNNRSFPDLDEQDFFDPYVSAAYGLSHLRWCMKVAGNDVSALAMYNAGSSKVKNGKTPQATLNYVSKILNYRDGLDTIFYSQVAVFYDSSRDYFLSRR